MCKNLGGAPHIKIVVNVCLMISGRVATLPFSIGSGNFQSAKRCLATIAHVRTNVCVLRRELVQ